MAQHRILDTIAAINREQARQELEATQFAGGIVFDPIARVLGGTGMGFFSSLLRTVGGVARSFLGVGAPARAAAPIGISLPARARQIGRFGRAALPGAIGGGLVGGGVLALAPGEAGAVGITAGSGLVRQTIVQTFDRSSGQVVRTEILKGAPYLMRREVTALKRVVRLVRQADKRIPRITRDKSPLSQLKDRWLADALGRGSCPPAPCN